MSTLFSLCNADAFVSCLCYIRTIAARADNRAVHLGSNGCNPQGNGGEVQAVIANKPSSVKTDSCGVVRSCRHESFRAAKDRTRIEYSLSTVEVVDRGHGGILHQPTNQPTIMSAAALTAQAERLLQRAHDTPASAPRWAQNSLKEQVGAIHAQLIQQAQDPDTRPEQAYASFLLLTF